MRSKSAASADRRQAAIRSTRRQASKPMPTESMMRNDHAPAKHSIKRSKAKSPGAVAKDSQGSPSLWAASPYFKTAVTIDSRWSR